MKKNKNKKVKVKPSTVSVGLSSLLSDTRLKTPETKPVLLESLLRDRSDIVFDPPYQRRVVWDEESKVALIQSINYNLPINTIHLVKISKTDGGKEFIVLDGKQRLTSIFDFIEGKFKINISLGNDKENVSFKGLENMEKETEHEHHARAKTILRDFRGYVLNVTYWSDLNLPEQSAVFNAINFGMPLTDDEKLLSKVYYCKDVAAFLMENYFKSLTNRFRSKDDPRSRDYIWCLRLLLLCLDNACDKAQINTGHLTMPRKDFKEVLDKLHKKVEKYVDERRSLSIEMYNSPEEMEKMFEHFGWLSEIKEIAKFISDIGDKIVVEIPISDRKQTSQISDWNKMYFTSFILDKYGKKILRYGVFSDNISSFKEIYQDYRKWTQDGDFIKIGSREEDKNRRLYKSQWYNIHFAKLEDFYQSLIIDAGIMDNNPKTKIISSEDRGVADQESNGICPVCKVFFTDLDKKVYDHGIPCSISLDPKKIYVMHDYCNRRKSDHTPDTAKQLNNFYIEQKDVLGEQ